MDSKTGHVYVTGQSQGTGIGSNFATVAYDLKGNQLWVATDGGGAIAVDSNLGNVYVVRAATTTAYDSNGNQLWVASDQPDDFHHCSVAFKALAVDSTSGSVYVTGRINCFGGHDIRFRTVAYDQTGTQLWVSQPYFGGFTEEANGIALGSAGNVYLAGYTLDDLGAGSAYVTPFGQYQAKFGGFNVANAVPVDSNTGNVYVTGQSGADYATVAYDSGGNQLWVARRTGFVSAIAVDGNTGNVIVTGRETQVSGTGTDFTTIAYSQDTTPPVTTATTSPVPNAYGWNNTNVNVSLNSTDSGRGATGVKQIQYALTGAQSADTQTVPGSTGSAAITAEGMTTLNYFGTDNVGNAEQSKALTVQIDKTPPVVSGMPATGCALWPPNNQMISVGTITAADALSGVGPGSFQMTGSSSEPSSDPNNPDVVITPNGSGGYVVQLRARRLGSGTGRIYTLNATATDLAGNTVTSTATCNVPRDASTAKAH